MVPPFDGEEAFRSVETQVAFGPRIPGTEGHAKALRWLDASLRKVCPDVQTRSFTGINALTGESAEGTNLIASFQPERKDRIFIGAHWDTRAHADRDPDPAMRRSPVPGASDGASGVAVLLGLADVFRANPPPYGVDLLFFDFEDQGIEGKKETFCIGSRFFAAGASLTGFRPRFGIVVDMVGRKDLRIAHELGSIDSAPLLMDMIFTIGGRIAPEAFSDPTEYRIYDDHMPFVEAGIPAVDIIGYPFPEWHTVADLPDICSPASMENIGNVILELLYGGYNIP